MNPDRRCTATANGSGERCRQAAIPGARVCIRHGGGAPQTIAAARQRLMEMAHPALAQLEKIVLDPDTSNADKLRGVNMILNRAGLAENVTIDVTVDEGNRYQVLLRKIAQLSPDDEDYDADVAHDVLAISGGEPEIVDAEVVDDADA